MYSTIFQQFIIKQRDVHPPLFYILVHFVSSIYLGHFSKYIIFSINLIFFILTCIFICKIFKLYNKEKWGNSSSNFIWWNWGNILRDVPKNVHDAKLFLL